MEKSLFKRASILGILGVLLGAFYREYTKYIGFSGPTRLSLVHPHFLLLGFVFNLLFLLLIRSYDLGHDLKLKKFLNYYLLGSLVTGACLFSRGLVDIKLAMGDLDLSKALDKSISGIAGIGHIILTISLFMILRLIYGQIKLQED